MNGIFSIVPIEVWRDKRLTLEQMRVLGVLFSFRGKNTDVVWPSRAEIAARCGMNVCNISSATTALERLGWLMKEGKGGHSKATRYTITVPEFPEVGTVAHSATVADSATVAHSATRLPVAYSATPPVAYSATRKEQTSEQTIEQTKVGGHATACPSLLGEIEIPNTGPSTPDAPIAELVALYHEKMPTNPRVKVLTDRRKGLIRARWREAASLTCRPFGYQDRASGLKAWAAFFAICAESAFLTGRATPQPGRPPFVADIDFLMSPSGFAKCLENKYHREAA